MDTIRHRRGGSLRRCDIGGGGGGSGSGMTKKSSAATIVGKTRTEGGIEILIEKTHVTQFSFVHDGAT